MKSVKPGRGPSMMGGVASVFAVVFGIIWMCGAASMGAPGFFLLFGVAFIGIGVVNAVYSFKNAAGENRYSAYDIWTVTRSRTRWMSASAGSRTTRHLRRRGKRGSLPTAPTAGQSWGRAFPSAGSAGKRCLNRIFE